MDAKDAKKNMKTSARQINPMRHSHLVGLAIIFAISPFTCLEASPFIEGGARCWTADEYIAKEPVDQASIAQIKKVEAIITKIGSIPNITPPLVICDKQEINAHVTDRNGPLQITTGMLKILGSDDNMIAALVGHEIAHLTLNHSALRQSEDPTFRLDAGNIAQDVLNEYQDYDKANYAYNFVYMGERAAFIRMQESEADARGIEFASKAGFNPEGANQLFSLVLKKTGGAYAGFFDDHPGFAERIVESGTRIEDESFDQAASGLASQQKWPGLNATIKRWLNVLPFSPNAWYYSAILHQKDKSRELEDLENTFTYSQPSLSKQQVQIDQAMLTMCIDLYSQEYIVESANCSRNLSDSNKDQFNKSTFRGVLIVGNNEPAPIKLTFIKNKDGGEVITNGDWPNIKNNTETPAWKPIRFEQQKR